MRKVRYRVAAFSLLGLLGLCGAGLTALVSASPTYTKTVSECGITCGQWLVRQTALTPAAVALIPITAAVAIATFACFITGLD